MIGLFDAEDSSKKIILVSLMFLFLSMILITYILLLSDHKNVTQSNNIVIYSILKNHKLDKDKDKNNNADKKVRWSDPLEF
jgi:hypothetical protein